MDFTMPVAKSPYSLQPTFSPGEGQGDLCVRPSIDTESFYFHHKNLLKAL